MNEPITLDQQIREVGRELGMRKGAYPKFVERKSITQAQADQRIAIMAQVYLTLKTLARIQDGTIEEPPKEKPHG
ncbi:MAG TPA: hypothetical protein VD867_05315 [Burkholderiales bacterium]|nr:hypothetical protein [Burkholderiales bacterium]